MKVEAVALRQLRTRRAGGRGDAAIARVAPLNAALLVAAGREAAHSILQFQLHDEFHLRHSRGSCFLRTTIKLRPKLDPRDAFVLKSGANYSSLASLRFPSLRVGRNSSLSIKPLADVSCIPGH